MHSPLITVLKSTVVCLSLTSLWACQYDVGERTLIQNDATTVVVERYMSASDAGTGTVSGCIAQPSEWSEPSLVEVTGTSQVEGVTQDFTVNPSRFNEGEATINGLVKMDGYTWYCYVDTARDYAYTEQDETWEVIHADSGKISYTLNPSTEQGLVFTTLGVEDGGWGPTVNQFYYNEMASHQILKSDSVAPHFEKLTSSFTQAGYDPVGDYFQTFQNNGSVYFVGVNGKALVSKMDGNYEIREVPTDSQIYLVNDLFIAFKDVSDPDTNTVISSSIQYSKDMLTWSETKDVSILNNVSAQSFNYDTKNSLYVVLNTATTQGQERVYFTSPDLENWTANTVGIWQNQRVVFAEDGRGVMPNSTTVDSLMSRTAEGEWESFEHYPTQGNYLDEQDTIFANNRFHVLLREYSDEGEGDDRVITYLKLHVGYSENLTDWTWSTLSTNEDEVLGLSELTALADNKIAISAGQYSSRSVDHFFVSTDNGSSWNQSESPAAALSLSGSVNLSTLNFYISSLVDHNGTTYGKMAIAGENNFKNEVYFSTTNFNDFNSELISNDYELFTYNNALYLNAAISHISWDVYRKIEAPEIEQRAQVKASEEAALVAEEAALASDDDSSGFGGIGFFELLMLIVASFSFTTRKK